MDHVTRQFINLTKKLRKELRKALSDLQGALHEQTKAISKYYERDNQPQNAQPPIHIISELHTPEDVERRRTTNDDRQYRLQRWNTVGTWLAFFAVAVYAVITYFQLRDFDASVGVSQTIARQTRIQAAASKEAADAAKSAAETAARQEMITEENLRATIEPIICKLDTITVGEHISAHCNFKNVGNSKAYAVKEGADTKRWIDLPGGPMPVKLAESGDLAANSPTDVYFFDAEFATSKFLSGLPELTVDDNPGNETLFFFARYEYFTFGQTRHTEVCWHLAKSNAAASKLPEGKTGYVLRQCKKWHSSN